MKLISIVVPVYNEQDNIEHFAMAVKAVMEKTSYEWELIFVDDGSQDDSLQIGLLLQHRMPQVSIIPLSRNYGHQIALTCGLDNARGEAVITMDGDMQHPPELLPKLLSAWEQGFDVVQMVRKDTEGVSWGKKTTSSLYYRLINHLSSIRVCPGGSDYRLLSRQAVEALHRYREHDPFIRGMVSLLGFRKTEIPFVAPARFAGKSKYSLRKMMKLAVDGIVGYSVRPLRWPLMLGLVLSIVSLGLMFHAFYVYCRGEALPGWTTLMVSMTFFGGAQFTLMGIMGEYLGRIFTEVKNRPLYLVAGKEVLEHGRKTYSKCG